MKPSYSTFYISLISIFLILNFIASPQSTKKIQKLLSEKSTGKLLKHGTLSVYAEFSETGKPIISFNSEKGLAPASNLKVVTSGAALCLLGQDFCFQTKVFAGLNILKGDILNSNLVITGSGDPTLGSARIKGSKNLEELCSEIYNTISELGIKRITGNIIADDLLYERNPVPDYWHWIDIGNYYGAGTSAFTINENSYELHFKPGKTPGDTTGIWGTTPPGVGLIFANSVTTGKEGSGDNGYIYSAPFSELAYLRGTVPAGVDTFTISGSIPNPPLFFARYLRDYLERSGIKVLGEARIPDLRENIDYSQMKEIKTIQSPPLKDIVFIVNKRSNNLYTEQILLALGNRTSGTKNIDEAIKSMLNFYKEKGLDLSGVRLEDGCGLSRTNMITTKAIGNILTFMTKQKDFEAYYNSFPIAGVKTDPGGFKTFGIGTPIENNARIKSGTIHGVRSFSGYISNKSGKLISFSMISNNYTGSSREIDELYKEILLLLHN
ncbi:MAG TPA: D-alanyl-D-alanine carboxypeptidase/D-alanyl-D-alanine-endopeptidase [Ignavibacteriaceae bacterium]|jgi:D-alanyl-D-alanine carboxypeptidase/D-alanyl-D-alanine-endopeptidase (penicillin-binding protein 4)|nr:D-alanyl-D-alanine carboxypeptidase/D-alanyl-D-alanine-endopeptidase [Ignavibacteriaceae bacterium]HOJ19221.1 D-alanyl-D-alanine carboxypeptidase/D-alanyl-D-alanine-endopeptidase [Ignavibacteriaceae bacterium]